jgi:hypothetical protein
MPKQTGFVDELTFSRQLAWVKLKPSGDNFHLYFDVQVDIVDPTEMVRRNWLIGLLQQAAVHQVEVVIEYTDDKNSMIIAVSLQTTTRKFPIGSVTTGVVKRVEIDPEKAQVTVFGSSRPVLTPQSIARPRDHELLIYTSEGTGFLHAEESQRRTRMVALLQQALAEGLSVKVVHANEPDALIKSVELLAKE